MRPGCQDARTARQLRREEQALIVSDLIIAVCLIAAIAAVYVGFLR